MGLLDLSRPRYPVKRGRGEETCLGHVTGGGRKEEGPVLASLREEGKEEEGTCLGHVTGGGEGGRRRPV